MESLTELRKHVQGSKFVMGTDVVMKHLRHSRLAKVFVASNCPDKVKGDIRHYCSVAGAGCGFVELAVPNDELGVMCKKPFSIAVVGVLK